MRIVKKYFIPGEHNEYKPHFLRKTSVAVLSVIVVLGFFGALYQNIAILKTDLLSAVIPKTLVDLANIDRVQNNAQPLKVSPLLEDAARRKAQDMAARSYFAHTSPDGIDPWHWFREAGYSYTFAGENLAVNFTESVDVNRAWMNSPTHKANILNGRFTEIGIATAQGYYQGRPTVFVVQMFGRPIPKMTLPSIASTEKKGTVQGASASESAVEDSSNEEVLGQGEDQAVKPFVIEETDTFIAVENLEATSQNEEVAESPSDTPIEELEMQSNVVERTVANPGRSLAILYLVISGLVLIALIATVFIEVKKQHPIQVLLALVLIVTILVLIFIYENLLIAPVFVL